MHDPVKIFFCTALWLLLHFKLQLIYPNRCIKKNMQHNKQFSTFYSTEISNASTKIYYFLSLCTL